MYKTLGDIIEDLKDNKKVEYDELRYAFLALESLRAIETMNFRDICNNGFGKIKTPEFMLKEYHNRAYKCLNAIPKTWLGDDLPENESYQKFHNMSKKLLDKFLSDKDE